MYFQKICFLFYFLALSAIHLGKEQDRFLFYFVLLVINLYKKISPNENLPTKCTLTKATKDLIPV